MTNSNSTTAERSPDRPMTDEGVALAWGAWTELGVSGWSASHGAWAIDPEPLIVYTAFLGDRYPRLRDEVTDWCIRNWRHVSKARLKNLVAEQPDLVHDRFGVLSATVSEHAAVTWPHSTEPRTFAPTERSSTPDLDKPSTVWLRLRTIFGLGARAEILRYFLSTTTPDQHATVAAIASAIHYAKRSVADECEALTSAGLLKVRTDRNRFLYSLAKRTQLEAIIAPLPRIRPDFAAVLTIARELVEIEEAALSSSARTIPVKAHATLTKLGPLMTELGLDTPTAVGDDLWPALRRLADETLGTWALGEWI